MRAPIWMFLAIAALFALPNAARATATYAWVPEDPSGCCRGVLELSDDAFLAGSASWNPTGSAKGNPVERFHFDGSFKVSDAPQTAAATNEAEKDVELAVRFAANPESPMVCCAWDFQLKVEGNGLSGRLRVTTQYDDIILVGTEKGWEIERAGSDAISSGVICGAGGSSSCISGRGRWILISGPGGATKASAHGLESKAKQASFHLR